MTASLLADAVLVLHIGVAAFVVSGPVFVVAGNLAGWQWVNRLWLRVAHLSAISFIVAEAWLGTACPLTSLEMWLRSRSGSGSYAGGFVEHWLSSLLYYQAPPWVFVTAYSAFGLIVLASWWCFPPRARRPRRESAI